MALADQIGRPPEMDAGLRRLWLESRCLDIVVEALDVIARQGAGSAEGLAAPAQHDALDARNHRRLRALREDTAKIALRTGAIGRAMRER